MSIKCVLFSDTHGCTTEVINGKKVDLQIPDGDVLIHCGDFSAQGSFDDIVYLNSFLSKLSHKKKYVVCGNHDIQSEKDFNASQTLLTNAILLYHHAFWIGDIPCFATSYQPFYKGWAYNIADDKKRKKLFDQIPEETQILISHCPPFGYNDKGFQAPHVGDKALLARIRELKHLRYVISGHLHNSYGIIEENGVTYINCSLLDDRYALKNKPIVIEI